jgi:hypothetical protein
MSSEEQTQEEQAQEAQTEEAQTEETQTGEAQGEEVQAEEAQAEGAQAEQILYAKVLAIGMYIGLLTLFVTFGLYVSGILAPAVPLDQVPDYWNLGVHEYLEEVNHDHLHMEHPPTGWAWTAMLAKGDFLNFIGIAILAGVTIVCYLAIVPTLRRKKDTAYLTMAVVEALVLALAASGILAVGH